MSILINKITIELYQESDSITGSELAEISVNPTLIGLFRDGKVDHYYSFKSVEGFSFNDIDEVVSVFKKIENIVKLT
jgi:hypothetical protein